MERVVFSLKTRTDSERGGALKPLLRSYSVLESLVEAVGTDSPDVSIESVIRDLSRLIGESVEVEHASFNPFDDPPETGVAIQPPTKRILVVDDEKTVAATVGLVLADLGIDIDVADDGQAALEALNHKPYSLVISDIQMPRVDGVSLLEQMRNSDAYRDIPVILLTGRETETPKGADDLIIKGSVGSGELRSRVATLLRDAPVVPYREKSENIEHKVLIVEDADTVAASIAFVLSQGPYEITIAFDGQDGWEKLNTTQFDLVISDWRMPRMNGIDLLGKVRSSAASALPFIILTSTDSKDLRQQANDLGVSQFLIKGEVGSDALLKHVGDLLIS